MAHSVPYISHGTGLQVHAEAHLPSLDFSNGVDVPAEDTTGEPHSFKFRYWINNSSRMYLLEGTQKIQNKYSTKIGDVLTFARGPDSKLLVGGHHVDQALNLACPGLGKRSPGPRLSPWFCLPWPWQTVHKAVTTFKVATETGDVLNLACCPDSKHLVTGLNANAALNAACPGLGKACIKLSPLANLSGVGYLKADINIDHRILRSGSMS